MVEQEPGAYLRRWPRFKIDLRLKVILPDDNQAFGRANNLSKGGMGAYIPCAIPIGTEIVLEVSFPNSSQEVKLKAVVRSAEGFRYGLEFVELPPEVRAIIEKNCEAATA